MLQEIGVISLLGMFAKPNSQLESEDCVDIRATGQQFLPGHLFHGGDILCALLFFMTRGQKNGLIRKKDQIARVHFSSRP